MSDSKPKYKLIVNVFACATIKKYKDQIMKINETWGKRAEEKGVKVLFFLGEEETDLIGEKYIYLKGVANDPFSASHKQNLGLKYIYENYEPEFVFICGSDTYINIDKLLVYLDTLDSSKGLYIGGHGWDRQIGYQTIYFHSGAGFIITNKILQYLYPLLENLQSEWEKICAIYRVDYLIIACDVCVAYHVKHFEVIKNTSFFACNHKGYIINGTSFCCAPRVHDIMVCHWMSLDDFDEYTKLLQDNNYFL